MRLSCRQLQVKVEELTEERSLQSSAATSTSLLSEIEQSMEAEELEQEREQVLATLSRWHVWSPGDGGAGPGLQGTVTPLRRPIASWEALVNSSSASYLSY